MSQSRRGCFLSKNHNRVFARPKKNTILFLVKFSELSKEIGEKEGILHRKSLSPIFMDFECVAYHQKNVRFVSFFSDVSQCLEVERTPRK